MTDVYHGLVWKKCSEGQSGSDCSLGTADTFTWQEALQYVDALNASGGYAGYTDWRLPNIKELASLVEIQCTAQAINETIFPATQGIYWSSTLNVGSSSDSWTLAFGFGDVYSLSRDSNYGSVRLVRGGQ